MEPHSVLDRGDDAAGEGLRVGDNSGSSARGNAAAVRGDWHGADYDPWSAPADLADSQPDAAGEARDDTGVGESAAAAREQVGLANWQIVVFARDVLFPVLGQRSRDLVSSTASGLDQFRAGILTAGRPDRLYRLRCESDTVAACLDNTLLLHGLMTCGSLLFWQHALGPVLRSLVDEDGGLLYTAVMMFTSVLFYLAWVIPEFVVAQLENRPWLSAVSVRAYAVFVLRRRQITQRAFQRLKNRQDKQGQEVREQGRSLEKIHTVRRKAGVYHLPRIVAEEVYSMTFIWMLYTLQSLVSKFVPGVLGFLGAQILLSWAYALTCFDYRWPDWELDFKLRYVEANWPFFAGFGVVVAAPSAIAEWWGGYFLGYGVWYLMYPLFVVNAIAAAKPPHSRHLGARLKFFWVAKHMNGLVLRLFVWLVQVALPNTVRAVSSIRNWFR